MPRLIEITSDSSRYAGLGPQHEILSSSWLSEILWDPDTGATEVTFKSGYVWHGEFTEDEFESLTRASSPGGWWHANIMGSGR